MRGTVGGEVKKGPDERGSDNTTRFPILNTMPSIDESTDKKVNLSSASDDRGIGNTVNLSVEDCGEDNPLRRSLLPKPVSEDTSFNTSVSPAVYCCLANANHYKIAGVTLVILLAAGAIVASLYGAGVFAGDSNNHSSSVGNSTLVPSNAPSFSPTGSPAGTPTYFPTWSPSSTTNSPTYSHSSVPSMKPSPMSTSVPTLSPSLQPSPVSTPVPTPGPTRSPSLSPSPQPTSNSEITANYNGEAANCGLNSLCKIKITDGLSWKNIVGQVTMQLEISGPQDWDFTIYSSDFTPDPDLKITGDQKAINDYLKNLEIYIEKAESTPLTVKSTIFAAGKNQQLAETTFNKAIIYPNSQHLRGPVFGDKNYTVTSRRTTAIVNSNEDQSNQDQSIGLGV